jgi:ubiquitin carboxyl-terminal hydrolase 14
LEELPETIMPQYKGKDARSSALSQLNVSLPVKVKWGKELYTDVDLNTEEEPLVFKAQLYALTGVEPQRQKVMIKGQTVRDTDWGGAKVKEGATLLLMGSKEEDIPDQPVRQTKFVEDMDESELQSALDMPAGLQNLGNTSGLNDFCSHFNWFHISKPPQVLHELRRPVPEDSPGVQAGPAQVPPE